MRHIEAMRIFTLVMALTSLVANGLTWISVRRTRRSLDGIRRLQRQVIIDAWRGGLEEAARAVANVVDERPDMEPVARAAVLYAESLIHERIRVTKIEGEAWVASKAGESSPSNSPTTTE
jgi:hypothetical protein